MPGNDRNLPNIYKQMKSFYQQHKFLIKILVSIALMAALMMRMDLGRAGQFIGDIHVSAWIIAMVMIFVQILALSYRWLLLINVHQKRVSFRDAVQVNLASLLANYLFITSIGGIIVRIAMSMQKGISLMRSIAATALDRVMTLVALLILTIVFMPVLNAIASSDVYHHAIFVIASFAIGGFIFAVLMFDTFRRKIIFSNRKIAMCFQYLRTVMTDQNLLAKIIASSLVGQIAYFMAVFVITGYMGIEFPWLHFISILPLITVIASLPVGYGGWGIREGAFVYGLSLIHVPVEIAFAVSVQIGLISMLTALLTGIPAVLAHNGPLKLFLRNARS